MATMSTPQLSANVNTEPNGQDYAVQYDYLKKELQAPIYKYKQLISQNQANGSGSSMTVGASQNQSVFYVPNDCVNLSRFPITLDASIAGQAAYATFKADSMPIASVRVTTQSGSTVLMDLQGVNAYTKTARWAAVPKEDYLTREGCYANTTVADALYTQSAQCQPNGKGESATAGTIVANDPSGQFVTAPGAVATALYDDQRETVASAQTLIKGASTAVTAFRLSTTLGDLFPGTLLAVDKTLFFNDILRIEINWQQATLWGWNATNIIGTLTELAGNITVTNYYLYSCYDTNAVNNEILKSSVLSGGVQLYVPYTTGTNGNLSGGTTAQFTTQLSSGSGLAVKRIISTLLEADVTAYKDNANNLPENALPKFTGFQSSIDSRPIQQQPMTVANGDDWLFHREKFHGSAIMGLQSYRIRHMLYDDFSDADKSYMVKYNDTKLSGLDITGVPKVYMVNYTGTAVRNLVWWQFVTYVRLLTIGPMSARW